MAYPKLTRVSLPQVIDVTVSRDHRGYLQFEAMHGRFRVHRTYAGYPYREARALFRAYLLELDSGHVANPPKGVHHA